MKTNLTTTAQILGWSTLFGLIFVFIWFVAYSSGFICSFKIFDLSTHECAVINYSGLGISKMIVYLFFFIPWLAIKLVLKKL